jgi:hypothetical protein
VRAPREIQSMVSYAAAPSWKNAKCQWGGIVGRRIAVVGAGHAGMLLAVGLSRRGNDVVVYSDRTADGILNDTAPTGTVCLFGDSITIEEELTGKRYDDGYRGIQGIHFTFSPKVGVELLQFGANLDERFAWAIDVRRKSADRMEQLEALGGRVVVQSVTPDDLDVIAGQHDLTFVASGRNGLASAFPRNAARSVYDQRQRELVMLLCTGIPTGRGSFPHRGTDMAPIVVSLFGEEGEVFWVPFLHKTAGDSWCLVIEARPGGPLDRFRELTHYMECFDLCREIVRDVTPWDWGVLKDMAPIEDDPHAWLKGAVNNTVRAPVAQTASGHLVMSVGDTSLSIDPIAGQGANCGVRQVAAYIDAIEGLEGEPTADWIEAVFESFWHSYAEGACRYTNLFLDPLDAVGVRIMKSCFGSPAAAKGLLSCYCDPRGAFPWIAERPAADAWIRKTTGERPGRVVNRGMRRILAGQVGQRVKGRHFQYAEVS